MRCLLLISLMLTKAIVNSYKNQCLMEGWYCNSNNSCCEGGCVPDICSDNNICYNKSVTGINDKTEGCVLSRDNLGIHDAGYCYKDNDCCITSGGYLSVCSSSTWSENQQCIKVYPQTGYYCDDGYPCMYGQKCVNNLCSSCCRSEGSFCTVDYQCCNGLTCLVINTGRPVCTRD